MKSKDRKLLEKIFARPVSGNIRWTEMVSLFKSLGAEISEAQGSRVRVFLFDEIRVFHRPHPSPMIDKGAVESIRKWFSEHEVEP
ncbi:MAG: type II toxin-antitoxin system HicA family toxin [Pyrinomonadaceae bacterium]